MTDITKNNSYENKPSGEENTYREGVQRASDVSAASVNKRFDDFAVTLKEFVNRSETKAQVANDALQALLESNLASIIKVTDQGQENIREAIRHIETRIGHVREVAETAVDNVDARNDMRQSATTEVLSVRLAALTEIVELRNEVNTLAINKAEQALERRLDALSEFNLHANTNEQNYVTRAILDARLDRTTAHIDKLHGFISSLQSRAVFAGIVTVIVMLIAQFLFAHFHF